MFGSILASVGSKIGTFFGGGILSSIGRYAGRFIGGFLDEKWLVREKVKHRFLNVKDSFRILAAKYGSPIPLIFGSAAVPGQIIWIDKIQEKRQTFSRNSLIKARHLSIEYQNTEIEYSASFAMALCEGEIIDIGRVWNEEQVIDLAKYNYRLYKGSKDQLADPYIVCKSSTPAPAYRDLAYIVFENLPLADFEDRVPSLVFEVYRRPNINREVAVEDKVRSMVMIPGSGEYVYDTVVQHKSIVSEHKTELFHEKINCHNHYNISNSIYSLNQLQMACKNVKWVSPVVCWFGDAIDAKNCLIRPAIEFNQSNVKYSESWSVGRYNRENAYEISKDELGNPAYGGTVNDASLIRYLVELRRRGLKIMLNPMIFMDIPGKPWRGKLSCQAEYVDDFFIKPSGYNEFIIHYANLVKNHVDAFIIGSEMIGLTAIRIGNIFPAVKNLIKLAQQVKAILGPEVLVTYAADWSEYHHTEGGWYNLDELWSSKDIDFIGIDAYFPITDSPLSEISREEIIKGFSSGEGYDYYVDSSSSTSVKLDPKYAWKNVRYWWENHHQNPDGSRTTWIPKSKKIWFTEFGFPSIDKATNQPNVFFDPKCIDGGVPKYSSGECDFSIQRKAISCFIDFWNTQEYVEQLFLWTWDARPYPAWPHTNIWRDNYLWQKGHWVNCKFGHSSLGAILLEISLRCGISANIIDVSSVDYHVGGFLLSNKITAINAINTLRALYFFDLCVLGENKISFNSRETRNEMLIDSGCFLKLSDNSFLQETIIPNSSIISNVDLYYISNSNYDTSYCYINSERDSNVSKATLRVPIILEQNEAELLGYRILKNAAQENKVYNFAIHLYDMHFYPGDFIKLTSNSNADKVVLRVIELELIEDKYLVTAISDGRDCYYISHAQNWQKIDDYGQIDSELIVVDLPYIRNYDNTVYAYWQSYVNAPLYAKLASSHDEDWVRIASLTPSNCIGTLIRAEQSDKANIYLIDELSSFWIKFDNIEVSSFTKREQALIGNELVEFDQIHNQDKNIYKITSLIRGIMGTEKYINSHVPGEKVIIVNRCDNPIFLSGKVVGENILFKTGKCTASINYQNLPNQNLPSVITDQKIGGSFLHLTWVNRYKENGAWCFPESTRKVNVEITIVTTSGDQIKHISGDNTAKIDISALDLSGGYKIDIIPTHQ